MLPKWGEFIEEIEQLSTDDKALEFLDGQAIKNALGTIRKGTSPELATNPDHKFLMRSLIVYRFLKKFN
jgi:asparagine synthase (glutamine-hydrolysing)